MATAFEIADQACTVYTKFRVASSAIMGGIMAIVCLFLSVKFYRQANKYVKKYNSTVTTIKCTGRECERCNNNGRYKRCYVYKCFDCLYGVKVPNIEGSGSVRMDGVKSPLKSGNTLPILCTKDGLNDCITEMHSFGIALGFLLGAIGIVLFVILFSWIVLTFKWPRRIFCANEAFNTLTGNY